MSDDYELEDCSCPKCARDTVHYRRRGECGGDGEHEAYDDDPMWYEPGDTETCETCMGKGFERWCPKCGYDLALNPEGLKIVFWDDLHP